MDLHRINIFFLFLLDQCMLEKNNFSLIVLLIKIRLTLIFQSEDLNFSSILGNSNVAFLLFLFSSSVNPVRHMLDSLIVFTTYLNCLSTLFISLYAHSE